MSSILSEQQVERPAAAHVGTGTAKVLEDVGVVAAGVFQRIGKDRKAVRFELSCRQRPLLVSGLGQRQHAGCSPKEIDRDGTERVANDVAQEFHLRQAFIATLTPTCHHCMMSGALWIPCSDE